MGRSLKASACLWPEWAQHPRCPWKGLNWPPAGLAPPGGQIPRCPPWGLPQEWCGQPVSLRSCPASSTGDYFGILKEARVTTFPFNILDNPMYWGSTANYLGWAVM